MCFNGSDTMYISWFGNLPIFSGDLSCEGGNEIPCHARSRAGVGCCKCGCDIRVLVVFSGANDAIAWIFRLIFVGGDVSVFRCNFCLDGFFNCIFRIQIFNFDLSSAIRVTTATEHNSCLFHSKKQNDSETHAYNGCCALFICGKCIVSTSIVRAQRFCGMIAGSDGGFGLNGTIAALSSGTWCWSCRSRSFGMESAAALHCHSC
mmetsp:Transcript_18085/g.25844  ORF Transcript_18085/g.25844 Transcript_18085/m.25844 type:complete len:205 (-) Transcript_18085:234-848(-)